MKGYQVYLNTCPCAPFNKMRDLILSGYKIAVSNTTETPKECPSIISVASKPK